MNQTVGALRSRRMARAAAGETYFSRYLARAGYFALNRSAWMEIVRLTSVEPSLLRGVVRIESIENSAPSVAELRGKVSR
jgi:hypothetical protein